MATKKKTDEAPKDDNIIKSDTLNPEPLPPAEVPPDDKKEKWEEDGMVRVTLAKPFTLNGKKYGPGEAVVPKDAWHVWKSCI